MRVPGRRRPKMRVRATVGAVVLAVVVTGGCASPRNSLGTSSSPCYQALPVAEQAVHHTGTLSGIRLIGTKVLDTLPRLRATVESRGGTGVRNVCVVSFHGSFQRAAVQKPAGTHPSGPYAIVVVTWPGNELLGTVILVHQPLRFHHEVLRSPPGARPLPTTTI